MAHNLSTLMAKLITYAFKDDRGVNATKSKVVAHQVLDIHLAQQAPRERDDKISVLPLYLLVKKSMRGLF